MGRATSSASWGGVDLLVLLTEDPFLGLLACPPKMLGHILENRGESSDSKWIVARDRDVVLSGLLRGEPQVASRLASQPIAESGERLSQVLARDITRLDLASYGDELFAHEVEPDQLRPRFLVVKMAENSIAHLFRKLCQVIRFREDRLSESASGVATLRRLLYDEDQLVHGPFLGDSVAPACHQTELAKTGMIPVLYADAARERLG
jgi:hypothetical protein